MGNISLVIYLLGYWYKSYHTNIINFVTMYLCLLIFRAETAEKILMKLGIDIDYGLQ